MKIKIIKEKLFYIVAIGISIFLLFFFITSVWIGYEVKNLCQNAKWQYSGNCTDALIAQLKDEHRGFKARNDAIWALGQIGNTSALPTLKSFYTGNIPLREPLNKSISQYELKKAIRLMSGEKNISAIFWNYGVNK